MLVCKTELLGSVEIFYCRSRDLNCYASTSCVEKFMGKVRICAHWIIQQGSKIKTECWMSYGLSFKKDDFQTLRHLWLLLLCKTCCILKTINVCRLVTVSLPSASNFWCVDPGGRSLTTHISITGFMFVQQILRSFILKLKFCGQMLGKWPKIGMTNF